MIQEAMGVLSPSSAEMAVWLKAKPGGILALAILEIGRDFSETVSSVFGWENFFDTAMSYLPSSEPGEAANAKISG